MGLWSSGLVSDSGEEVFVSAIGLNGKIDSINCTCWDV